ncbi:MAG: hypothetical protein ABJH45_02375 [Paracoccaceae bacterium]
MKVIENTTDRLLLRKIPWIMGSLFVAIMVIVANALWRSIQTDGWQAEGVMSLTITLCSIMVAVVVFIRYDELVLDRKYGTIQFRHISVFQRKSEELDLSLLESASIQTHYGQADSVRSYRLVLILKDHPDRDSRTHPTKDIRPPNPVYSTGKDAKMTAEIINTWLN